VLICINENSAVCSIIRDNAVMCVNVLRAEQIHISGAFSGHLNDKCQNPFDLTDWESSVTGSPVMTAALVSLDCRIDSELHYGTHYIFVGEIKSLKLNMPGPPLIYHARMYETLGQSESLSLEEMEYSWERYT